MPFASFELRLLRLKLAVEKGASSDCHGFAFHKGDFCDAIALRYGWSPQNLNSL